MKSTELPAVPLTMSTLEIAGLMGKRHDHVLRDVRKMMQELDITLSPQFWGKVSSEGGAPFNVAYLQKRECLILVSGYSVEMRARIIDRWLELETALAAPQNELALTSDARTAIGGIVKSCTRVVVQEIVQETLASVIPQMIAGALAARGVAVRRGKTAGQLWHEFGFLAMRGAAQWFSRRLIEMECGIEDGGRAEMGISTARLFDPDKARRWIDNGGRMIVERYIAGRRGQTVLPFRAVK